MSFRKAKWQKKGEYSRGKKTPIILVLLHPAILNVIQQTFFNLYFVKKTSLETYREESLFYGCYFSNNGLIPSEFN